jgi:UDP-glucose:(heptosyl)LPS alpha-1,3-glucosyltransferase
MKIALVILHADPRRGGAERYTIDVAAALAERGHDVTLLARSFHEVPARVRAVELRSNALTRLGQYNRLLDRLDEHLAGGNAYDVVHAMLPVRGCDVYHPHAGVAAEAVVSGHMKHGGRIARRAAAVANRLNRKRNRFAEVERALLSGERPPLVLCLSDYVKEAVKRHYALPEERLFRLFNGIDLSRFDPAAHPEARGAVRRRFNLGEERLIALMIAQDFERKGLGEAIEAVARVNDPNLVLVVVGRDAAGSYRRLARELGVGERVIFAGPTGDPVSFYAAADVFVLPTRHDPCSLVVLEALAMGLPVISTAQNGACEIMADGREGFVVARADDIGGLAEGLRAMAEPARRRAMGEAALALRPQLSQENHVERLLVAYGVAAQRGGSGVNG